MTGRVELVSSHDPNVRKHTDYSGVVAWLEPAGGNALVPASARHAQMIQKNKTFSPHVLANHDGNRRGLSELRSDFSQRILELQRADLRHRLVPPGATKSIAFRREGVVRVFCNIHPAMSAVIVVLRSPYFAVSDKSGSFQIANVPPGSYRLHVFHERATEQTLAALTRPIEVGEGPSQLPPVQVSESGYLELPHKNKFGKDYPPTSDSGGYMGTKP